MRLGDGTDPRRMLATALVVRLHPSTRVYAEATRRYNPSPTSHHILVQLHTGQGIDTGPR